MGAESVRLKIEPAHQAVAKGLATLHRQEIETGFLSKLGGRFLELLYRSMIESDRVICLVALDKDELAGFICGCENTNHFYKDFLSQHFFSVVIRVMPALISPGVVRGVYESLRYSGPSSSHTAELLSMVVGDQWRGSGVAAGLIRELAIEFKGRGVADFKVVAGANLGAANAFYRKMGLRTAGTIEVHAGAASNVYEAHVPDLIETSKSK